MNEKFLGKAYSTRDTDATRQMYDAWSTSYDDELGQNGYATPRRCAKALRMHMPDPTLPILDFGCGTGLSGEALRAAGFTTIDGIDLSPQMLEQAEAKELYRSTRIIGADATLAHTPGDYAAIAAIGVIGVGAAPASTIDLILNGLASGGKMVFSLNDNALKDRAFEARLNEWTDCGAAHLILREYGPHLPGIDLNANVYVVEKN